MNLGVIGTLAVLALIDSTSIGTLIMPIWLLMAPGRIQLRRILLFLGTVACSYLALGLALSYGATTFLVKHGGFLTTATFRYVELVIGVVLIAASEIMDSKKARARAEERATEDGGRVMAWRSQLMHGDASRRSTATLLGLAFAAVLVEAASMLPYLTAIGIITTQVSEWPVKIVLLVGYCFVMITPALILSAGRLVAHDELQPMLERFDSWFVRRARTMAAWVTGVLGFIVGAHGAHELWFTGT